MNKQLRWMAGVCGLGCVLAAGTMPVMADGPQDNIPDNVRAVPPEGIELSAEVQAELQARLAELDGLISQLRERKNERINGLLPDVEIFRRAVHDAVMYRELYSDKEVANTRQLAQTGIDRARELLSNRSPWTTATGLVVRGYVSKIDQTVQPYGLVIPQSYSFDGAQRHRLDLWFHGRGEKTSEAAFIHQRMTQFGNIRPVDTIVLHPYGRYSNAFKFAGEIDVLEALEHAKQNYRVDEDRVAVRGFSMGGAGCWQMAVHYPDLFFAANPGAGFSETPDFLRTFQGETLNPTWFEQRLWRMYDCTDWAVNLRQLPTVAYSGEIDRQKQAADMMEAALARENLKLTHLIGPQTGHSIHPDSLTDIEARLASLARRGREHTPTEIHFVTYTLRYNRTNWLTVTALGEHWEAGRVDAVVHAADNRIEITARNITGLKLDFPAGESPFRPDRAVTVVIDGESITLDQPQTDRTWSAELHRAETWQAGAATVNGLAKRHRLQGPIDDAFMESFIVVPPSGHARHAAVDTWSRSECDHLIKEWRRQFRGDAVVRAAADVTDADIAASNLILFGDPASNPLIAKVIGQLPVTWSAESVAVGNQKFDAAGHAPVLIYPNPLNPNRYVVINSGFTYREFAYLNNARQVSKLPDWSIIDLSVPPNSLWPGKVVAADFFNEQWQVKP